MAKINEFSAIMWAFDGSVWRQVNRARPGQEAVKDTRGTKPAVARVTLDDLRVDLEKRRSFALKHDSKTVYMITEDGKQPAVPG